MNSSTGLPPTGGDRGSIHDYQPSSMSSSSATFDSENPPAFVALSDVLIEPYSSDYNPYSNPVDYETVAAQTPEARRFIYGLGSGGVLSRGADTTRLETSVVEPNSTQPDLANPQTDDNIEADRDLQTQAPPAENPQSEPSNQQVELAQPPTTDFTKTLLADETFEALVRTDYDPFWMRNTGLDPSVLAEWTSHQISRYKIGQFFSAVFKTGDIFRLPIILEGASVVKTAVVHSILPNVFSIGPTIAVSSPLLTPVHGLGELEADLVKEAGGKGRRKGKPKPLPYQAVEVFRAGQSLGNLYDIRQAFHLYQDQVEIWAVKTNQLHLVPPPRRKQPPHNSNMVYENGVLMRREDDGSLAPADDQLMFRTHIQMARRGSSS